MNIFALFKLCVVMINNSLTGTTEDWRIEYGLISYLSFLPETSRVGEPLVCLERKCSYVLFHKLAVHVGSTRRIPTLDRYLLYLHITK